MFVKYNRILDERNLFKEPAINCEFKVFIENTCYAKVIDIVNIGAFEAMFEVEEITLEEYINAYKSIFGYAPKHYWSLDIFYERLTFEELNIITNLIEIVMEDFPDNKSMLRKAKTVMTLFHNISTRAGDIANDNKTLINCLDFLIECNYITEERKQEILYI